MKGCVVCEAFPGHRGRHYTTRDASTLLFAMRRRALGMGAGPWHQLPDAFTAAGEPILASTRLPDDPSARRAGPLWLRADRGTLVEETTRAAEPPDPPPAPPSGKRTRERVQPAVERGGTAPQGGRPRRKIVIVDDDENLAWAVQKKFESLGYEALTASEGRRGAELVEQEHPNLVILDLNLPDVDGLDICRYLRQRSDVPIIMLTGRAEQGDEVIGLEVGADDYVTKPFNLNALVARVRAVLRRTSPPPV